MADSLFDLELPDDGDRVSLIGAPAEEPSSRASASRARSARSASRAPLAVRMRPRTIDEVLGQEHQVGLRTHRHRAGHLSSRPTVFLSGHARGARLGMRGAHVTGVPLPMSEGVT